MISDWTRRSYSSIPSAAICLVTDVPLATTSRDSCCISRLTGNQDILSPRLAICSIPAPTGFTFISPGTSGIVTFLTVWRLSMKMACSGDVFLRACQRTAVRDANLVEWGGMASLAF